MNIICLGAAEALQALAPEGPDENVQLCAEVEELAFDESQRESVFVVMHRDERVISRIVRILRQDPRTGLQPLYTVEQFGKPLDLLTDGVVSSLEEARLEGERILLRLDELDEAVFRAEASDYLRILALLYSRPDRQLAPHRVWLDEHAYAYTLLEALLGSAHLVAVRLANLCELGHLQRRGLIDRTSHCPVCSSLQLNLVDHCPHCGSTDIEEGSDVQCLHCGYTAQESAFVSPQDEGLVCVKCHKRLRQIKTDYDLVQGIFSCRTCSNAFVQPAPQAHCLRCGKHFSVDRLLIRRIYSYELTASGITVLKKGAALDEVDGSDAGNLVTPHFFTNMVNWLLDFCGRHSNENFTLIGIRLDCRNRNGSELSQAEMELMDTFVYRISEHIRNIDMLARFRHDLLWLLLPRTGKPHYQVVMNRLDALEKTHRGLGDETLTVRTVLFHAPDDIVPGESSPLLLARLEGRFGEDEDYGAGN